MCNLYRMTKNASEVADWFDALDAAGGANFGQEVYPGYPGLVVAAGEVRTMVWGFPLVLKGKQGQKLKPKPVNNARTDKLGTFFWRHAFEERRCLIPLTGWAEAEGPKGRMTRTWLSLAGLSLPDSPLFAAAGVWRHSEEWGACYSMVMTDSAGSQAASVHGRMPVLLAPKDYARWTGGTPDEALALCRPWQGGIAIDRTAESWRR
ncbi:MAG: SOS response-associated peptidase family protein [Erythrobacter sp.]|jgi:putative SOS response-associated peptidase YedK|nr:SOS response-associated peptidase family protein [Erythrobacter sp.]